PDLPGDFAGGIIQLNTKEVPEKFFANISLGINYNTLQTFQPFYAYQGGKYDWLGIDDGTRSLAADFPDSKSFNSLPRDQKMQLAKGMSSNWAINRFGSAAPNINFQFALGTRIKLDSMSRHSLGIIFSMNYGSGRKFSVIDRNWYNNSTTRAVEYEYTDSLYQLNVSNGGMLNLTYKMGANHKFVFKNSFNRNFEDQTVVRSGRDYINGNSDIRAYSYMATFNNLLLSQLSGEHFISANRWKFEWNTSYGLIKRNIPDFRNVRYQREHASKNPYEADININVTEDGGARFYSFLDEDLYNGGYALTIPLKFINTENNQLKVGGFHQYKQRDFSARLIGVAMASLMDFDYGLRRWAIDSIYREDNFHNKGFVLSEITNPSHAYNASANLNAGYIMLDNRFAKKFRVVWGLRYEAYRQVLHTADRAEGKPINIETPFNDLLPSLNFTYSLSDKSNLRFAASRTVSRPEFRELAPFAFYDFNTSSIITGNPDLIRTNITNMDVRYETYPKWGETFSVSLFYKKFTNPIELMLGSDQSAGNIRRTYMNVASAQSYGVEFEVRKSLSFFAEPLNIAYLENFTLFGNIAIIRSVANLENNPDVFDNKRPLQGQSPYVVNGGIQFQDTSVGITAVVLYNRFGARISDVGTVGFADIYEKGRSVIDLQFSKDLFDDRMTVKLGAADILSQDLVFFQNINKNNRYDAGADDIVWTYKMPSFYSFGLSYKF
ncbi:MAG: TonB-dependent receptor, partial [Bacteroidota bacterium]|nr:TonB-dependent receptor [Bacteroidota bacterium]